MKKNLIRGNNKKSYKTLLFPFTSEFLWCPNIAAYLMSMTERFNHSFVKNYLGIPKEANNFKKKLFCLY